MFRNYLKVSFRNLLNSKSYTLINIIGLSVGIACFIVTGVYVNNELSYDRFTERADDVYRYTINRPAEMNGGNPVHWAISHTPTGELLKEVYPQVEQTGRISNFSNGAAVIEYKGEYHKEQLSYYADGSIVDMFGYPQIEGNAIASLNELNTVVLSIQLASRIFGDKSPIGEILNIDGRNYQVGAILDNKISQSHFAFELLVSYTTFLTNRDEETILNEWRWSQCWTYLELAKGADPSIIEADFQSLYKNYIPQWNPNIDRELVLQRLPNIYLTSDISYELQPNGNIYYSYLFGAIGVFILLLAIVNYMNLATARSLKRAKEIGVRKTLGSKKSQLIAQFITESTLLVAFATVVGLLLVELTLPTISVVVGKTLEITIWQIQVFVFAVLLILMVGIISGSYPAFYLSNFSALKVLKGDRSSGRGSMIRKLLVVFQFGVTVILILATFSINSQLNFMVNQELGYDKNQVAILSDNISHEEISDKLAVVMDRMELIDGVETITVATSLPVGTTWENGVQYQADNGEFDTKVMKTIWTDYQYLKTLDIELIEGRNFSEDLTTDIGGSLLINETLAKELNWENPIGRRMRHGRNPDGSYDVDGTVIGIVKDFHYGSAHKSIEPLVIMMMDDGYFGYLMASLSTKNLSKTINELQANWASAYPDIPFDMSFLDAHFNKQYENETNMLSLFSYLAAISIIIACLGLFGLASFIAEQRTKEIGVRKVIGATVSDLVYLISKDFILLIGIAFIIGTPIGYLLISGWLENFAYHTNVGVITIAVSGLIVLFIGFATVGYKAYKAAISDPVKSLRYE
ncbi:MAG: ABC transporter permease [Cyclobacteriaceae bacterium]